MDNRFKVAKPKPLAKNADKLLYSKNPSPGFMKNKREFKQKNVSLLESQESIQQAVKTEKYRLPQLRNSQLGK